MRQGRTRRIKSKGPELGLPVVEGEGGGNVDVARARRGEKAQRSVGGKREGHKEEGAMREGVAGEFSALAHTSCKVLIIILSLVTKQIPFMGIKLLFPPILYKINCMQIIGKLRIAPIFSWNISKCVQFK